MFEFFGSRSSSTTQQVFDERRFQEGLAELLAHSGLDPDARTFAALYKMLADDVQWYFEQVDADA